MSSTMSRRRAFRLLGASALALAAGRAHAEPLKMVVHRSATCGCCGKWVARMRDAGYAVEDIVEADMSAVKKRLGVPAAMESCHTAEIEGFIVEGHVPAAALARLLSERPKATGLAAPGMPGGSPGMESAQAEPYQLYLFDASGARPFGTWLGDKPA